jgi:hypothetical protein
MSAHCEKCGQAKWLPGVYEQIQAKIQEQQGEIKRISNLSATRFKVNEDLNKEIKGLQAVIEEMNKNCISIGLHESRMKAAEGEIERLRLQLAGCGVAALCNTRESAEKQRITKENPYWSASYGDVCDAVEREMNLRDLLTVIAPSWLPEGIRLRRQQALELGKAKDQP